jgi:hypothetical protein
VAGAAGLIVLIWPRKTSKLDYITPTIRDSWYGPIRYIPSPTIDNPEGITITNDFKARNIVTKEFPIIGVASIHRLAAPSLEKALREIKAKGWADKIRSFEGGYYPRYVRGSTTNLSSHSYGTSIDINAGTNPQGGRPTPNQTDIASIFERNGWYWGNRFSFPDPMHFEFVGKPKGVA